MAEISKDWKDVLRKGFVLPEIAPDVSLGDAVIEISMALHNHFMGSSSVRAYLEEASKGEGTLCPDSPIDELIRYVAERRGSIDKSDPLLNLAFIRQIVMPVFEFEREQMETGLAQTKNLTPLEKSLFTNGVKLAGCIDRLWAACFEKVAAPWQSLDEEGQEKYKKDVKDTLDQFDYTVFDWSEEEGITNRQTWVQAFPVEIKSITGLIDFISGQDTIKSDLNMFAYMKALSSAYGCIDIEKLEEKWAEVDRCWVKIFSRVVPVHGMENGYEHPFCVSLEFRLVVRTDKAQDMISRIREATIRYSQTLGLDQRLIQLIPKKLENMDIAVFASVLSSGFSLNFGMSGQVVPNRQEILAEAGKIFLDSNSAETMSGYYQEKLINHCLPKKARDILRRLITPKIMLKHTIMHEFFHPVGCSPEIDGALKKLGDAKSLLEEAKASMGGFLVTEFDNMTPSHRLELVTMAVARILRFFDKDMLANRTAESYVRENMVVATCLLKSGVMKLTKDGVDIDLGKAMTRVFFVEVETFVRFVIKAYIDNDLELLQLLVRSYCNIDEDTPLGDLINWVNR